MAPVHQSRLLAAISSAACQPPARAVVLDDERLAELRSLFPGEETRRILRALDAEMTAELTLIAAALTARDPDALAAATHRMRNSATMIGATDLADVVVTLGDTAGRDEQIDRLAETWKATTLAIAVELGRDA